MNLHQVLTGAVNPGDSCFSVGNVGDEPFTAYASGCDIVILASDFERLQIIPGAKHGNIQVGCVDCSMHQGKIAASYGNVICIFEPIALLNQKTKHSTLNYQWQKSGQFALESVVHNLAWDPQGIRLLTGSSCLQLWSNGNLEANINEEEAADETDPSKVSDWRCIWESKTASPIHLLKVSPDGEFFATVGKDDCLVKVWYNSSSWQTAVMAPVIPVDKKEGDIDFSFVYLAHPRAVTGFSWRKTSKYMPRGLACNVLLTCCKDNVCRLWAETLLPSDTLISGDGHTQWSESVWTTNNLKRNISNREKLNFRSFRIGRRRSSGLVAHSGYLPHQQDAHEVHRNSPLHANSLCHFHIAASINPATDIPLLPSITSLSLSEHEETNGPFVVHWLNNKELHFTLSMEVFLQQLRRNLEQQSPESVADDVGQMASKSDDDIDEGSEYHKGFMQSVLSDRGNGEKTSSAVMIDHKIEVLFAEWNKNADMLFSIHPIDGSLLVWHVDWLDEYQPGMFRQVQVSFASRIPVAFPTGDANSLSKSIVMYACTKNVDLAIQQGKLKPPGMTHSTSGMLISAGQNKSSGSLKLSIFTPNVLMISKHADGSLNQWAVSFAEESAFSTVLGVSHKSRYCGHRFHLNDLACHSVLPLLLTTSYHNAIRTPDDGNLHNESSFHSLQFRSSLSRNKRNIGTAAVFQDSNAIYSELILWRVDPVGPLSYSGGVSELARINSLHVSAFSNVAWLPTLIPSYCLGAYCNSPSACFVASDGHYLRLYQAVIDAKKLLSELSNPEIAKFVGEVFNIVSQQSTARPGCIIELDAITELYGKETQLLHVFKEDFILVNQPKKMQQKQGQTSNETSPQQEAEEPHDGFSEKFFLVVIEHKENNRSVLHMWHMHLKSDSISVDHATETPLLSPEDQNGFASEKLHSPFFKKYQACKANLQSASRLALSSKRVYSQELALPEGVEITRVTPSAGHLSSSSVHPACLAPYLLATSCSDGKVRFWRCQVSAHSASSAAGDSLESKFSYCWEEWPLLIEGGLVNSSAVSVPGRPVDVSCSYTSRLAVAYKQSKQINEHSSKHFTMHVCIFECESTGGSQWILEQTIHLDDLSLSGAILDPRISIDSNLVVYNKQESHLTDHQMTFEAKPLVHLDWVSKEDGSHILTIGIGSKLLMYGQVSGMIQNQAKKEAPAVFSLSLWDNAKEVSQSRWVLLRSVDLVSSVDGSLSLPVSLSWVRDGILVVGMDCEMHVYSQWQPHDKLDPVITEVENGSTPSVVSLAKYGNVNGSNPYLFKKNLTRSMTGLAQKFGGKKIPFQWNVEMEDSGLFEASHDLSPTLPQYHPLQLLELMDLGKIRRSKAILSHLVKCIAGEVITVNDAETSHERRLRSLTISASGSTARDPLMTNKSENPDYTEIDSIPPLPLCALLAADEDISHTTFEKPSKRPNINKKNCRQQSTVNNYDELFAMSNLGTDLPDGFSVDDDIEQKVIDLSQYSLTYFGPEHARVLSSHLLHSSLPGLTSMEQMFLMALADTVATISTDIGESRERTQGGETLDECGLRFLLAMRLHTFLLTSLPPVYRAQLLRQGLSTCHFAWAFHSEAEEELLNMIPAMQRGDPHWSELRAMGIGWWVRSTNILRRCIEKVAKAAFQRNNDPLEAAIFYLAMKKKAVLWGLFRSLQDKKMTEFFGKNFSDDRWRKAALKNAFALLGKQRFEQSAAFFLLGGSLKDAVEVCLERLHDVQLALVIARLYESEFEVSSTYKSILVRRILGYDPKSKCFNFSLRNSDPVLRSMAYWILEDYTNSLNTLLEQGMKENDNCSVTEYSKSTSCSPGVFNFYNYLRTHPLLLRRHFASSEKTMSQMGLTVESDLADKISLAERRLFFSTANAHFKAGCPMLALEVLSKMPAVTMKPKNLQNETSSYLTVNFSSEESKHKVLGCDCSSSIVNGLGSKVPSDWLSNGQSTSSLSFDWSQSSLTIEDQPLELKWDSDKEDEEEETGLSMKEINPQCPTAAKIEGESYCNFSSSADDFLSTSEDVIAAQLKFGACLKILTTELRTLSTGYEVDGGKLRFQLYNWLEREITALQKTCNYNVDLEAIKDSFDFPESEHAGNGIVDQQKSLHQQRYLQRRRLWLLENQPLLRMFLSYCSLHGSHGGGLASVRMELILLLQESQQEHSAKQVTSPFVQLASIPLLFACTASAKTVVANPRLHLSNLTQDIVNTIVEFDSPPHPDMQNNKIYVMHTVAASLSACLYQCLCDGHYYGSSYANQFTGMVYQSFLFAQQRSNRAASLDGTITPNTSPDQWPGIKELNHLLNSAGDEDKPKLTILLCEVLTAVYLSLFVHGLGTHSSNELFRLVAHPLDSKMWAAVFGGGVQQPLKNQIEPKSVTGRWLPEHSQQQIVMYSVDCVGFSKALAVFNPARSASAAEGRTPDEHHNSFKGTGSKATNREAPSYSTSLPVVSQVIPVYKEKFIPPELSIWDYFIAKPFIPAVQSKFEYDSEESQDSDDEEDVFASGTQLQEHSNSNSFSWSLMRYAMVQLVLHNLKKFYPMAGLDLSELPVCSPSCHAILKTLQRWEQVLLRRLELFGGPPKDFISMHASEGTMSSGPALLIHKALLEPTNTPFKSKHHTALPVKRLWQYLVKQEEVQEIFIRNIFTKQRCHNESVDTSKETNRNSMMEEPSVNKVEADSGYPGGRARIVHKESDIITAFAINKANRNCVAIATSHDIQELDVSAILATQIYTWVEDEFELESKGSDEFLVVHARDDFGDLQCSTPYTPTVPGTPINMPWLGSMQTGRGASVMIKRNMNNARRMASHPTLPYYLTGAQDGSVRMFEWGHSHQLACFRPSGNSRITRIRFNHQGNKFGIVDGDGFLSFWQTSPVALGATPKPYLTWQCHNKTANDFVFVSSSTLIATAGQSSDNRNICLWDTLVPQTNSLVHAFTCHDSGATVLAYVSKQQLLISGGRKGYVCIFDLRQRLLRQTFQAHDSPIKAIAVDTAEDYFITGSAEGNMKVWSLSTYNLIHTFSNEHARQSLFRNIGTGVMQIETGPANHMFSCGADGTMKMRVLPDRFSTGSGKLDIWQDDVRFIL